MRSRTLAIRPSSIALAVGLASAGGCYGTPRTSLPDSGGSLGDSGGHDSGVAAISIASPRSPTYTNASVTIEVSLTVPSGNRVQLLKNGTVLAELNGPPHTFTWDTTGEPEGTYQVVAQTVLDGRIVMAEPVTIVVDRTAPTIASSIPASGATNVSLTDPIRVIFSEALSPSSVTGNAVRLAFGSAAVNSTASLAADGKTLDIAIADRSSLILPGSMTETVASTITDLAGNLFAGAAWNVSVPLWVDMGTLQGGYPQMVLGAAGEPIVVTGSGTLRIGRSMGGTEWESIPSPQTPGTTGQAANTFGIAASVKNNLFIAWIDSAVVQLARWTGTAWDRSWPSLGNGKVYSPSVAIARSEQPIVYWQSDPAGQGNNYFFESNVSEWNGARWTGFPGLPMGPCNSVPCRVVLDESDFPAVEVKSSLFRWSGSGWIGPVGSSLAGMAVNDADQVLSIQDTGTTLQVVALSASGSFADYVPVLDVLTGGISAATAPALALDNRNQPILAWYASSSIGVARWTGAIWDRGYGALTGARGRAAVVIAPGSVPIVAWEDVTNAGDLATHVAKSNR